MIIKVLNTIKQVIFKVKDQEVYYRRVIGGLAWPAPPKPGWLVVIGEDLGVDQGLGTRRLKILAEAPVESIAELHLKALELRHDYQADVWMGHTKNRPEVWQWRQINARLPMHEELSLRAAPYAGEAGLVLFQIIDNQIMPGRKILAFGAESKLAQEFMGLKVDDLKGCVDQEPALAALGYAVAEIILQEPMIAGKMPAVNRDWNNYDLTR